jgi:2-amino-4-hydroxy-6-hydroxymethyldihydropteridine diphosphokinase
MFWTCFLTVPSLSSSVAAISRSRWYLTAPVPRSDQPDFVNGVIAASTTAEPTDLLTLLHRVEETFGRVRSVPNAARPVDLDLLDYNGLLRDGEPPILPHPRLHQRAFVLYPLRDVAPGWVHPRLGKSVDALIGALPPDQPIRVLV